MPSLLFPNAYDLPNPALAQLADAYETARDELIDDYEFAYVKLSMTLDTITDALLFAFRSGMRDNRLLSGHAAFAALSVPQSLQRT